MDYIGAAAAVTLGLALGLYCGRLLNGVVTHWETAGGAVKASLTVIAFLLGGGAGAIIFKVLPGSSGPSLYVLALGIGLLLALFVAKVPTQYSLTTFKKVVSLSDSFRTQLPDPEQRALLILSAFASPKAIEKQTGMDEKLLAAQLERAADALSQSNADGDDAL